MIWTSITATLRRHLGQYTNGQFLRLLKQPSRAFSAFIHRSLSRVSTKSSTPESIENEPEAPNTGWMSAKDKDDLLEDDINGPRIDISWTQFETIEDRERGLLNGLATGAVAIMT